MDPGACRELGDVQRGRHLLEAMGLGASAPLFLSVGRIESNKGFDVLVDALARADRQLPERWAWVLVGAGPQRAAVEAAVTSAGIGDHVRFAGSLADVDLHSIAEVANWFVHPTLYEGSSIVTLEAMAHGLPVIGSRAGGLPDKVHDGTSGYLVAPGDAAALAEAAGPTPHRSMAQRWDGLVDATAKRISAGTSSSIATSTFIAALV